MEVNSLQYACANLSCALVGFALGLLFATFYSVSE